MNATSIQNIIALIVTDSNWLSESLTKGPFQFIDPLQDQALIDSSSIRPFCNSKILSAKQNSSGISPIPLVLFLGYPPTIFFAIIPIIINSIYTGIFNTMNFDMFKIRSVHVITKIFKRIPQTLNTTATITRVTLNMRVSASIKNGPIANEKTSFAHAMSFVTGWDSFRPAHISLS